MSLNHSDLFGVTDDLEKILVTNKVESCERLSLLFKIISESFLDLAQHVRESFQVLLKVWNRHNIKNDWLLSYFLHESGELVINASEFVELSGKHGFDVSTSEENTLEVDISSLDIDPVVKDNSNSLQFLIPRNDFLLKYFVVRRHFHGGNVVDVLVNLNEQIIPSSDESALALISDEL